MHAAVAIGLGPSSGSRPVAAPDFALLQLSGFGARQRGCEVDAARTLQCRQLRVAEPDQFRRQRRACGRAGSQFHYRLDFLAEFLAREVLPHHAQWERDGLIPRDLWRRAGAAGILLPMAPAEYGGGGGDFLFTAIVVEEIARVLATGLTGFTTHSDVVAPYLVKFGSEAQKRRWIPLLAAGEVVASIAMTEPQAGSDLKALRTTATRAGQGWLLSGQKTFITNGYHADRVLVVAKTDPSAGARGMSLFWVDAHSPGFARDRRPAADVRRLRLHARVSDRACAGRRPRQSNLRGIVRDHEGDHQPDAVTADGFQQGTQASGYRRWQRRW